MQSSVVDQGREEQTNGDGPLIPTNDEAANPLCGPFRVDIVALDQTLSV